MKLFNVLALWSFFSVGSLFSAAYNTIDAYFKNNSSGHDGTVWIQRGNNKLAMQGFKANKNVTFLGKLQQGDMIGYEMVGGLRAYPAAYLDWSTLSGQNAPRVLITFSKGWVYPFAGVSAYEGQAPVLAGGNSNNYENADIEAELTALEKERVLRDVIERAKARDPMTAQLKVMFTVTEFIVNKLSSNQPIDETQLESIQGLLGKVSGNLISVPSLVSLLKEYSKLVNGIMLVRAKGVSVEGLPIQSLHEGKAGIYTLLTRYLEYILKKSQ